MIKPFHLVDVGKYLRAAAPDLTTVQNTPISNSTFSTTSLLRVPGGSEHSFDATAHEELSLLVLEGYATVTVDNIRQTLGSGQLLTAEPGASVKIWNETQEAWLALTTVTPPLTTHKA